MSPNLAVKCYYMDLYFIYFYYTFNTLLPELVKMFNINISLG